MKIMKSLKTINVLALVSLALMYAYYIGERIIVTSFNERFSKRNN